MHATMPAPRVFGQNAQLAGLQSAPAIEKQASPQDDAIQKAFEVVKKILDSEIQAYRQRAAAKEDQNGQGYTAVGIGNKVTGQVYVMAVRAQNILKYISQQRLKEIDQMDSNKRVKFELIITGVAQKLCDPQLTKEHPFVLSSCENLNGKIAESKLIRSIVVQVCKL